MRSHTHTATARWFDGQENRAQDVHGAVWAALR